MLTANKLKLDDDKTEVMIISSSRMSTALSIPDSFDIGNASVPCSDTVKNLGVTLDCHLSLKTHVLNLVRTANFELRRIGSIRSLLTTEAAATLVSAFILLSRSALLIVSLLSDPELKLTFSVLPTNCLNLSVVICAPQSFISCVVG